MTDSAEKDPDLDYLKGNTPDLAAEWEFDFVVSHCEDNRKIPESEVEAFWEEVLDAADRHGFAVGGSWKAITDADYEAMDKEESVCICPSYPFEPEGESDESDLCPIHGGKR